MVARVKSSLLLLLVIDDLLGLGRVKPYLQLVRRRMVAESIFGPELVLDAIDHPLTMHGFVTIPNADRQEISAVLSRQTE